MYYKVKTGTKECDLIVKFKQDREKWGRFEVQDMYKKILGISSDIKVLCSPDRLVVEWTVLDRLSEDIRSQFSKRDHDGQYDAKKASRINKEWIAFCKSFGLNRVGFMDLLFELGSGWIFYPPIKLQEMFDDFYFECSSKGIEKETCLEKLEEHEYYLIKSNWSKESKENK